MDQFNKIGFYQRKSKKVLDILEEVDRPLLLQEIKELYKRKFGTCMPFSEEGDANICEWLDNMENIGRQQKNNQDVYFMKKPQVQVSQVVSNESKRKTSSPIISKTIKRSRSAPENDNKIKQTLISSDQSQITNRQSRCVQFKGSTSNEKGMKTRSKSEDNRQLSGVANIYGSVLIGDDFLLGVAIYRLKYIGEKHRGRLQSGFCVSGLTISKATMRVKEIKDETSYKSAIIYVGSIDIAAGRDLIHMIRDMKDLMNACAAKSIRPILCTLADMPNYFEQYQIDTLNGFNKFIAENPFGIPVIDINKCFKSQLKNDTFSPRYYLDGARNVSGFKRQLVFWSKEGRDRMYNMLVKNLGLAIVASETILLGYI